MEPSAENPLPSEIAKKPPRGWRLSLREYLGLATIAMLVVALTLTNMRLQRTLIELRMRRAETGYIDATDPNQIAAARMPSDQPLMYRVRLRVPGTSPAAAGGLFGNSTASTKYRLAYSSMWPRNSRSPQWFGAVSVPPGESVLTVRVMQDPRDDRWKISTIIQTSQTTKRMATALPRSQVAVFQGSYDVISTGIPRGQTVARDDGGSIRVLDERWLVGEGSLMLYGDKPPAEDQLGVYAELQPDSGPL